MKILVIGTWRKDEAKDCQKEAEEIGRLLADKNHVLLSGGGTGVSQLVVESYRRHNGKKYVAYFPSKKEMKKAGEKQGVKPDQAVWTKLDYPMRNLFMVKDCDAVIAVHGGLATLTEVIHAAKDYPKNVAVIDRGELASWIRAIPELRQRVFLSTDVRAAMAHLEP